MIPVLIGTASLAIVFVVHVAIWRIRLPRADFTELAALFAIGLIGAEIALAVLDPEASFCRGLFIAAIYVLAAVCYVSVYTAIELDSPSLSLIAIIRQQPDRSLDEATLERFIVERPFVTSRLGQLLRDGMLAENDDKLHLTGSGQAALAFLDSYRRLIRRDGLGG